MDSIPDYNYPNWPPGRIQSLKADEEIVLKQFWTFYLKFWGYPIDINKDDILIKSSFVASASTIERVELDKKINYQNKRLSDNSKSFSLASNHDILKKFTNSFNINSFGHGLNTKKNSKFIQVLQNNEKEKYKKIVDISKEYFHIYAYYHNQKEKNNNENCEISLTDDSKSIESFKTAFFFFNNTDSETNFKPLIQNEKKNKEKFVPESLSEKIIHHQDRFVDSIFSDYNPEVIHNTFFTALRKELADNFFLRFIRARNFDLINSIKMNLSFLNWRHKNGPIDSLLNQGDSQFYFSDPNGGLIKNFTCSKFWANGHDREGNKLFFFQTKKHFSDLSTPQEIQMYSILNIEWCRLFLIDVNKSNDQCTVIIDMIGFSKKNADYTTIKFLAEVFEARYPESLKLILIHNAPWIFSTVWTVIKNWLDPIVSSKVFFTKDINDLTKYVSDEFIPKYLNGKCNNNFKYVIPHQSDIYPPKKKDEYYYNLKKELDLLFVKFLQTTKNWIESKDSNISEKYLQDKIKISTKISKCYVEIDPYIRARGVFDRNNSYKLTT